MKMKKTIWILLLSFFFVGCSKDDDNDVNTSAYAGVWLGTYSGDDDNGIWQVTISNTGEVNGTASSYVFEEQYSLSGTVTEAGVMNLTVGNASSGSTFVGQLDAENGTGSGTWVNNVVDPPINGTWIGVKQ